MTSAQSHSQRFPLRIVKVSLRKLLCLAVVGYIDCVTGYEFNLRISRGISPEALAKIKRDLTEDTPPNS